MKDFPKVAIVYLSYHSEPYITEAMDSVAKLNYPKDKIELVIVDNPHPEHGPSIQFIKEKIMPRSGNCLPQITLLPQQNNAGFCGGNNVGIKWAIENGCKYVYLYNQDGEMDLDCLVRLVETLENDLAIGCAQSLVLLHPEVDKINTAGNSFHYLGYGFIDHFGEARSSILPGQVRDIGYATGSSLIMRSDLIQKLGMLDEDLFAYHEDVEYSLRLKFAGYRVVIVSDSVFFHKYVFSRSSSKFYFMERNRYAVLLMYYKWQTIILLLPILAVMEIGMTFFFWKNGWWKEKVDIYRYWFSSANLNLWLNKRKLIQSIRKISDRELLRQSVTSVHFGEKQFMNSPLLRYIANPLMMLYGWVVKAVVFW